VTGICSVGANFGSTFALWDVSINGKPTATGTSFADGGGRFRWCRTFSDYFAISALSASKGAAIHVYNAQFIHAGPTPFTLANRPLKVADFDFLGGPARIPRIAAGVGKEVVIFVIGY
jgi:hypothetical protein